jgi:predicted transcriptional regulator
VRLRIGLSGPQVVFLAKIDAGLAELNAGRGVPHDDVKRRLGM